MNKLVWATLILAACFVGEAYPQQPLVAEQVTKDNAAKRLFAGTDANGGIGDWYLSNGVVEAVIDNVAFQDDLVKAANISRPQQNGIAPTGGTLIDLGLVGKNNDQFNSMFQVCNIDPANAFFYTGIKAVNTDGQASIVIDGIVLFTGISTLPGTGGPGPTLVGQTVFSIAPGDRFITVSSTIINGSGKPAPLFNITDAFPLVGRSTLPFAAFPGRGFNAPVLSLTPTGIAAALGVFPYVVFPGNVRPEDGIMDTITRATCGEVSYGVAPMSMTIDPDGPAGPMAPTITPLPVLLGVTSAEVTATGNAFDPAKSPMIPAGGSFTFTRRIFVGERNDVASVSDQMLSQVFPAAALGTLTGDIDAADSADLEASIIITGGLSPFFPAAAALPITQVRTDKSGKFSATLPAGDYTLSIVAPNRDDMNGVKVTVAPGVNNVPIPRMSAAGSASFTVSEKGQAIPAKLTFIGVEGTSNPDFNRFFDARMFDSTGKTVTDLQASAITGTLNFVFATNGSGKQALKPGRYQVIASRGLEYTIARQTITVNAGQDTKMDFALERVVDTKGFVSADFHVHSGKSFDASVPLEDRIRSFAAENVEVVVSTEHNYIADYAPIVSKLMLNKVMKTIVGDELTTSLPTPLFPQAFGHHIAFPIVEQPFAPRRGAPFTEYVPAATFYDRVKTMNPNPSSKQVIQLNHPRAGLAGLTLIGLFNIVNYSPTRPIPIAFTVGSQLTSTTRNIDFDAMELMNGDSISGYQVTRNDWFGLINQGFTKTATAVSDSHRAVVETPGFPVSFVASPTDDPSAVKDEMVTSAVLSRNLVGTSGPFIRFNIQGQPIGSLVKKQAGKVKVDITVSAPAWVPVDEVRLLENGKVVMTFDANSKVKVNPAPSDPTSNQGVERFKVTGLKVKPSKKDSFFTVEAGIKLPIVADLNGDGVVDTGDTNGDGKVDAADRGFVQPPSPPIYAQIAPGFTSLGFTNPIFIDRNGNGKFDNAGVSASAQFIDTPAQPIDIETDVVESLSDEKHHIRFPWYGLKVGAEEIKLLHQMLDETTRQLIQPKQGKKGNEK